MKLQLFLSHNGVLSRRKALESIVAGAVEVNGRKVTEPSMEIDPGRDKVAFKGTPIASKRFEYIMLNKPSGYVTTCEGQFDQRTVIQLLPREFRHLRPVGRLDKDTEGLLLFTNDGWLANRLMHPSFDVDKTYFVRVRWHVTPEKIARLAEGIIVGGEKTAPAEVKIIRDGEKETELEVTIHEGKKRQVRIMLSSVGNPVLQLKRLRQGPLQLGNLRSADWRRLSAEEVEALKNMRPPAPEMEVEDRPAWPGSRPEGRRPGMPKRPDRGRRPGQAGHTRRDPLAWADEKKAPRPSFGRQPQRTERHPLDARPGKAPAFKKYFSNKSAASNQALRRKNGPKHA
ncbi:MAG: pseudouridine synthase [Candidatus Omnitrophica bacterium]|nr:pseudouridine synthase [Candidatus Omnitrophota bacterium]